MSNVQHTGERIVASLTEDTPRAVRDVAALALRLGAAAVFIAHGRGDIFDAGVSANVENYRDAGIPLPGLSAPFAAYMQFFGGIALVVGLLTRPVAAGLAVVMAGALIWVHGGEGLVMGPDGSGSGYAFAMGVVAVVLSLVGPGRISADRAIADWARGRAGSVRDRHVVSA
jgi:putative oxidoreductase